MPAQKKSKLHYINAEELRQKLKFRHLREKTKLSERHPHAVTFFREKGIELEKIREHSAKLLSAGALAGALFLNPPTDLKFLPTPNEISEKLKEPLENGEENKNKQVLLTALQSVLPKRPRALARNEEKFLEQIFEQVVKVKTRATLEGEHLNTTYGYIGAEQHLQRFPGDSLGLHGSGGILKEGIAPGRGAWGYFAKSKDALSPDLIETEKWYAVVQTLYLPDWNRRQPYLRDWYKYRKVLIVNTLNGNAVVASIADSGPAAWTGKHFGGSPEVMDYLGGLRYKKGPVILFFVDDPDNKVPLGPVEYNRSTLASTL